MTVLVRKLEAMQRQLDALKAAASTSSAVIAGDDGSRIYLSNGRIWLWDDYNRWPETPGLIMADPGAGINYLRIIPPFSDGSGYENSFTLQGRRPGETGHAWIYSDGTIQIRSQEPDGTLTGAVRISGALATMQAGRIELNANHLGLYSLPTTSAAANLHLGTVGGQWTVAYITSSRRYKQDIEDIEVDPQAVLAWRPRSWRDKNDVAAVGDEAKRHIGFIAEEVEQSGTPEFVTRDDEDRADGLLYDRMTIGLHAVARHHEDRIAELEAENARKDRIIAALCDAVGINPEDIE